MNDTETELRRVIAHIEAEARKRSEVFINALVKLQSTKPFSTTIPIDGIPEPKPTVEDIRDALTELTAASEEYGRRMSETAKDYSLSEEAKRQLTYPAMRASMDCYGRVMDMVKRLA